MSTCGHRGPRRHRGKPASASAWWRGRGRRAAGQQKSHGKGLRADPLLPRQDENPTLQGLWEPGRHEGPVGAGLQGAALWGARADPGTAILEIRGQMGTHARTCVCTCVNLRTHTCI